MQGSSAANETRSRAALAVEFDERRIDSIFAELDRCHLPGVAVGIAIGGKPVYRKGFGLANMELPVVLSPKIRMRIYSTTKHFTCFAYMLLCEEGRAGIDDPIGKHLPELHPVTRRVTVRQLMGNMGGLRDVHDIRWQFCGMERPVHSDDLLLLYRDIDDVNFPPGTAWSYNNGGFLMLSIAIERITGQSLEEVLRTRIFEPVGMYDTLLRRFDSDFVPNSATMHMTTRNGAFDRSYLVGASAGEGGIVSTVDNMLRWLAHMDAPVIGSPTTWKIMKAPQRLANGTPTGYGLGLMTDQYRGVEILHHGGGGMGSNSQMLKVPAARLDVAIMVNREDVSGVLLTYKILDACLLGLEPPRKLTTGSPASGTFRSPVTGRVIQLVAKEGQQLVSTDGLSVNMPFETDSNGVLKPAGLFGYAKQVMTLVGDRVKPRAILFSDFGNLDELIAVAPVGKVDLPAIAGRYRGPTIGVEAKIHEAVDGPRLSTTGRFGSAEFDLEPLGEGLWRARSRVADFLGGILSFECSQPGFSFTSLRTRALRFRRED